MKKKKRYIFVHRGDLHRIDCKFHRSDDFYRDERAKQLVKIYLHTDKIMSVHVAWKVSLRIYRTCAIRARISIDDAT